jgi:hypothetical protein
VHATNEPLSNVDQSSTNEKVAAIELSAIQEEYLATLQKDYDTLKETSDRQNALVLELQTKINLLVRYVKLRHN